MSLRLTALLATLTFVVVWIPDRLLHHPDAIELPAALAEAGRVGLTPWPSADAPSGWLHEVPAATGTLLLFHGNAGHAIQRQGIAVAMADLGLRTLLAEYPGYGHRSGKRSEDALATDAAEQIDRVRKQFGGQLIVAGKSLGAGVAAAALARRPDAAEAVLLITPWKRLDDVAAHHFPWLPVRLLLRDRYDSAEYLLSFRGRKIVLLAENDVVIPARFGRALHDGLPAPRALIVVAGAGHNDWLDKLSATHWRELAAALGGTSRKSPANSLQSRPSSIPDASEKDSS